ncbi:MAG: hypothetical protein IKJ31_03990 [Bacteroidaceae bacterium]|nr:hypothetical protein [Bacteroidaceae bacterium]
MLERWLKGLLLLKLSLSLSQIWNIILLYIKPIPNIKEKIQKMIAKYRAETIDIEDVEYEEADLEEDVLFTEDKDKKDVPKDY